MIFITNTKQTMNIHMITWMLMSSILIWGCEKGTDQSPQDDVVYAKEATKKSTLVGTWFREYVITDTVTVSEYLSLPASGNGKWVKYENGRLGGGTKGPWTLMPNWGHDSEEVIWLRRDTCFTNQSEAPVSCALVFPNTRLGVLVENPFDFFCLDPKNAQGRRKNDNPYCKNEVIFSRNPAD